MMSARAIETMRKRITADFQKGKRRQAALLKKEQYHLCIAPDVLDKLARIVALADEIARNNTASPGFRGREEAMFYSVAQALMSIFAQGGAVPGSAANGCILIYTTAQKARQEVTPPPTEEMETQFCRLRHGPCQCCVDQYRRCRYFYEVA